MFTNSQGGGGGDFFCNISLFYFILRFSCLIFSTSFSFLLLFSFIYPPDSPSLLSSLFFIDGFLLFSLFFSGGGRGFGAVGGGRS